MNKLFSFNCQVANLIMVRGDPDMWGKVWNNLKSRINSSLEKLAKENEKSFGKERLDCCNLNNRPDNAKEMSLR